MDKNILLNIRNRYIKNILLKSIAKADIGVLDIIDADDMAIKLDAFGDSVVLAIFEIVDNNMSAVRDIISQFKKICPSAPVMAIVYKDTSDIVKHAMKLGVKDILFLTKNIETYEEIIQTRMAHHYKNINKFQLKDPLLFEIYDENMSIKEALGIELKRAVRGDYSLSFIIAYLSGNDPKAVQSIANTIKKFIRDTDKMFLVDNRTFVIAFPFVEKIHVPTLEEKFREAFKKEEKKVGINKKLCLYSSTFPDDGDNLEQLLDRLEKGINNSMVINSVQAPLNSFTQSDIEDYKKKIRQYKKFF